MKRFSFFLYFISFQVLCNGFWGVAYASLGPTVLSNESLIESRINVAVEINESLDPDFLEMGSNVDKYLFEIDEAALAGMVDQLSLLQVRLASQAAEFDRMLVVSHLDGLCGMRAEGCEEFARLFQGQGDLTFEESMVQVGAMGSQVLTHHEWSLSGGRTVGSSASQNPQESPGGSSTVGNQGSQEEQIRNGFIRAFDREHVRLTGVRVEMVSMEKTSHGKRGWQEAIKEGQGNGADSAAAGESYLPTLAWVDPKDQGSGPIPLVSSNTVRILQAKFGGHQEGGIVFGRVASGWAIKWLGEGARHPIFLNDKFDVLAADSTQIPRYFIFSGLTPGSGSIQMISTLYPWSGSVRFPVISAKATYLDLSRPAMRRLTGQVIDRDLGSDSAFEGVSIVRVAGQESPWTTSDQKGAFRMDQVLTVGHYPLFLDVQRDGRTTLRYRVLPERTNAITLYRMREREIDSWRAQLNLFQPDPHSEGYGLNREAPLVVGFLRNPIAKFSDSDLLPFARLFPSHPAWSPVPHVRSPGGILEKDVYLSVHDSRVVAAQLPNTGFLLGVQSEGGEVLFSEWGFTSRGVVNVIGPE